MNKLRILAFATLIGVATPHASYADSDHGEDRHGAYGSSATAGDMTEGEVRKVDNEGKKITLMQGQIKNLEMPAMTWCSR